MKFNLSQQIAEVQREIGQRRNVYARMVSQGKMRQGEADYQIALMEAVKKTLILVQTHEETIREIATRKDADA